MFKIGDPVADKYTGSYIGTITGIKATYRVTDPQSNDSHYYSEEELRPAPPKLLPEEAWLRLPGLLMEKIKKHATHCTSINGCSEILMLYEEDRRAIRHECYQFLGNTEPRIKITGLVREYMANAVEDVAERMGILVWREYA